MNKQLCTVTLLHVAIALIVLPLYSFPQVAASSTGGDETAKTEVAKECACTDPSTGGVFDFCYHLPQNRSVGGKRFSCDWLEQAKELRVLDSNYSGLSMTNLSEFQQAPIFVTAASENHFDEAVRLIGNLQSRFSNPRVVFYDIGLSVDSAAQVRTYCKVEYRRFPFEKFPNYVGSLFEYRWKPIIIAETIAEFQAIWWLDSSIVFINLTSIPRIYRLLEGFVGTPSPPTDSNGEPESPSFAANDSDGSDPVSFKFPFLLHGATEVSIFASTIEGMYDYIPVRSIDVLKSERAQMFGANCALIVRTKYVVDVVLKWWLLCALEEKCMAPAGHHLHCNFKQSRYTDYAECHRYDQSALNLLLANQLDYDFERWSSGIDDFYDVYRWATKGSVQPQDCSAQRHTTP